MCAALIDVADVRDTAAEEVLVTGIDDCTDTFDSQFPARAEKRRAGVEARLVRYAAHGPCSHTDGDLERGAEENVSVREVGLVRFAE